MAFGGRAFSTRSFSSRGGAVAVAPVIAAAAATLRSIKANAFAFIFGVGQSTLRKVTAAALGAPAPAGVGVPRLPLIKAAGTGVAPQVFIGAGQIRLRPRALQAFGLVQLPLLTILRARLPKIRITSVVYVPIPELPGHEQVQAFSTFSIIYTLKAHTWTTEEDAVQLELREESERLQQNIQALRYGGSGGSDGIEEMNGRTRPMAFGECHNVIAQIIDPNILTYQVNSGPMDAITNVYDSGALFTTLHNNVGTYDTLAATSVPVGAYSTCRAEGYIKLGGPGALGTVTADVKGSTTGGYSDKHGGIMKRILLNFSQLDANTLDTTSFDDLDILQPAPIGVFLPAGDESKIDEVIHRIAHSCGAIVGQDAGRYRTFRLDPPPTTSGLTFNDREIADLKQIPLPYRIPWRQRSVGYAVNWTIQEGSQLVTSVSSTRRAFLESQYRWAIVHDQDIAQNHRTSGNAPPRQALFVDRLPAEAEAVRLLKLYAKGRTLYQVVVPSVLFKLRLGQIVTLKYPRYNLSQGRNFIVMSVSDDAATELTEFVCFG